MGVCLCGCVCVGVCVCTYICGYMCVQVHLCMLVCVYMSAHRYEGQMSHLGEVPQVSSILFLRQGLSLAWNFVVYARLRGLRACRDLPVFASNLPSWITGMYHHI